MMMAELLKDPVVLAVGAGIFLLAILAILVLRRFKFKIGKDGVEFSGSRDGPLPDSDVPPNTAVSVKADGGSVAVSAGRNASITVKTGADEDNIVETLRGLTEEVRSSRQPATTPSGLMVDESMIEDLVERAFKLHGEDWARVEVMALNDLEETASRRLWPPEKIHANRRWIPITVVRQKMIARHDRRANGPSL
jgi:hypothetical protein